MSLPDVPECDNHTIFRDGKPLALSHFNMDRVTTERSYALTVAAAISALHPQEEIVVRNQYREVVAFFVDGYPR